MNIPYILAFSDISATLEKVGGKGVSLSKLMNAGFPVPDGFHVTTEAYRLFVKAHDLQAKIEAVLKNVDPAIPDTLESASAEIRTLFTQAEIPSDIAEAIRDTYKVYEQPNVSFAVRSSATAEDLPGASFAGQQETYLNVRGVEALLEAVRKCWASLWTARAIAYRIKNNIGHSAIALAVVVQEMVNAEAAGILFTANPINGRRDEMVINAAWGLGESIVGGLVSPDMVVADSVTGKIKKIEITEKTILTVKAEAGTQEIPLTGAKRKARVLNDGQVVELIKIARKIESYYGVPQDIEWCLVTYPTTGRPEQGSQFFVVQSRPITTPLEVQAFAPLDWKLPRGTYAVMRNNIVELMANPLSPLFETLGLSAINTSLSRLMEKSFGMRGIMPSQIIIGVNHYAYNNGSVSAKGMLRLFLNMGKIARRMFTGAVERWMDSGRPHYLQVVEEWRGKNWKSFTSLELVESVGQLLESAIDAYGALVSGLIPAAWITEAVFTIFYDRMIKRFGDPPAPVYLLGFDNIPIRAEKSLYDLAEWVRQDLVLTQWFESTSVTELASSLKCGDFSGAAAPMAWQEWRQRFHEYLAQYGNTLYDLDFIHPVPAEDPSPVLSAMKLFASGKGVNPYTRQRESAERREQAVLATEQRLKGLRLKWFKQTLASAQKYGPLREDGLAEIGLAYPLIWQMLYELGQRFVVGQAIAVSDDIFWMTEEEVRSAATRLDAGLPLESLSSAIRVRKAENQVMLSAAPPMVLPQMKIFGFDLMSLKDRRGYRNRGKVIKGVASSPGKATGVARVLHGPEDFSQMSPGDILVAPITTPAWTPLFAMASAIVTDVGGPLSHGSIVAREYGIPAVLGTGVATRRIQNGQVVEVDGTTGMVVLHT